MRYAVYNIHIKWAVNWFEVRQHYNAIGETIVLTDSAVDFTFLLFPFPISKRVMTIDFINRNIKNYFLGVQRRSNEGRVYGFVFDYGSYTEK